MKGKNVKITFSFELLNWGNEPALGQVLSALDATEEKAVEARKISSALPGNQLFVSTILRQVVSFSVSIYHSSLFFFIFLFFFLNLKLRFVYLFWDKIHRAMNGIDRIGLFSTAIRIREGNNISMRKVNKTALHLWEYPSLTIYFSNSTFVSCVKRESFHLALPVLAYP